ncbi:methionine adenosyltransferase domain-containing protein [Mesorhizobium japonicum]|uniref:methionine adenosyltransferase domain-containing protein n=1 Tax=Mesorhizobium japonicum TaxID=2066070 RepID=UPI003CCEC344
MASGLADVCEVQLDYAIGVASPVSVMVNTFGAARVEERRIEQLILSCSISNRKALLRCLISYAPIYRIDLDLWSFRSRRARVHLGED